MSNERLTIDRLLEQTGRLLADRERLEAGNLKQAQGIADLIHEKFEQAATIERLREWILTRGHKFDCVDSDGCGCGYNSLISETEPKGESDA